MPQLHMHTDTDALYRQLTRYICEWYCSQGHRFFNGETLDTFLNKTEVFPLFTM